MRWLIVFALAGLTGCAGSVAELTMKSPEALQAEPSENLAYAYGWDRNIGPSKKVRTELERRGTFTAEEWARIDAGKVHVGDSEELLWCAWGVPNDEVKHTSAGGSFKIAYYNRGRRAVEISGGRVQSITGW